MRCCIGSVFVDGRGSVLCSCGCVSRWMDVVSQSRLGVGVVQPGPSMGITCGVCAPVQKEPKRGLLPVGGAGMSECLLEGRAGVGRLQVSVDLAHVCAPGGGLGRHGGHRWRWLGCSRSWLRSWRLGCRWWSQTHAQGGQRECRACGQVGHLLDAVKGFAARASWRFCLEQLTGAIFTFHFAQSRYSHTISESNESL